MKNPILVATFTILAASLPVPAALAGAAEIRGSILFWAVDRNGDGVVDRGEVEALTTVVFDSIDLNDDGRVTREEAGFALVDDRPGVDQKTAARLAKRREEMLVKLNLTKPEGIPLDEYVDRSIEMFHAADGDGNSALDPVEFASMTEAFGPLLP